MKLRISSSFNLHPQSADGSIENIARGISLMEDTGFDAADFTARLLKTLDDGYTEYIGRILDLTASSKIRFELCHLPFDPKIATNPDLIPDFNARMYRAIDGAALLGVDYAVLHPNTITLPLSDFDRHAAYDSVMTHLEPFVDRAARVGLNLALENLPVSHLDYPTHRYTQYPDELCELADALGIGICWDLGHGNISALRQSDALRYLGSRVKVLHVNDNAGFGDDHLPPFDGTVDWVDAMHGLRDIGFGGLFNYEIATVKVPDEERTAFARRLTDIANKVLNIL